MPSSGFLQGTVGRTLSGASYQARGSHPAEVLISVLSECALGQDMNASNVGAIASSTYPQTNLALGFQFVLAEPFLVQKVWWANGATATTDNADVAVYTEDGLTRLVAGGSTLIATANIIQEINCTDTVLAAPGRYWCVYNQSGVTATPTCIPGSSTMLLRIPGVAQFAGAVSLGTTFTPAANTTPLVFPFFGIAGRVKAA